ncbi:hypothetical protein M885DRAFT_341129 [Pelagophyceae sp. CCMP2097]|nr:hypothetical protein M885DRAFT_341129 [Pelagophyceae sp. CCMP2097]
MVPAWGAVWDHGFERVVSRSLKSQREGPLQKPLSPARPLSKALPHTGALRGYVQGSSKRASTHPSQGPFVRAPLCGLLRPLLRSEGSLVARALHGPLHGPSYGPLQGQLFGSSRGLLHGDLRGLLPGLFSGPSQGSLQGPLKGTLRSLVSPRKGRQGPSRLSERPLRQSLERTHKRLLRSRVRDWQSLAAASRGAGANGAAHTI